LVAPPVAEPAVALVPPVAEPPATLAPPVAEPPVALAPPVAELALAPPVAELALTPPVAEPPVALAPPPPVAWSVEPPVEGALLVPPAPLWPALLPPFPPVCGALVDGPVVWVLPFELQPRLTPAAYNTARAATAAVRICDRSSHPICIATTLHEKKWGRRATWRRIACFGGARITG